jgi:hypothetical protein
MSTYIVDVGHKEIRMVKCAIPGYEVHLFAMNEKSNDPNDGRQISEFIQSVLDDSDPLSSTSSKTRHKVIFTTKFTSAFSELRWMPLNEAKSREISVAEGFELITDQLLATVGEQTHELAYLHPLAVSQNQGVFAPNLRRSVSTPVDFQVLSYRVKNTALRNYIDYFNNFGLTVAKFLPPSLSTGLFLSAAHSFPKNLLVIDFGWFASEFCVFENGLPMTVQSIPIGLKHVISDIQVYLGSSDVEAWFSEDGTLSLDIANSKVYEAAFSRLAELATMLKLKLKKSGLTVPLDNGVLVGGGASLPGIEKVLRKALAVEFMRPNLETVKSSFDRATAKDIKESHLPLLSCLWCELNPNRLIDENPFPDLPFTRRFGLKVWLKELCDY